MKFSYAIAYVADVPKTVAFYVEAFGFEKGFQTPENDYGELKTGETTLAFASYELGQSNFPQGFKKPEPSEKPWGVEFAFTSENIEEDFEKAILAGATEYMAIQKKPWGQKVGYLRDNNGFLIEICSPMAEMPA